MYNGRHSSLLRGTKRSTWSLYQTLHDRNRAWRFECDVSWVSDKGCWGCLYFCIFCWSEYILNTFFYSLKVNAILICQCVFFQERNRFYLRVRLKELLFKLEDQRFLVGMLFLNLLGLDWRRHFSYNIFGSFVIDISIDLSTRYAEMPEDQKNNLSHRYKALEKLRAYLRSLP